jgi:lambda family phage tail tape measure protein
MTVFRIDVLISPKKAVSGTKRVGKELDRTKKKARSLESQLKKAFAFIGIAFVVKELAALGDAFTNLQNRLRVVTTSQRELVTVTEDLLQVANRSRSSFQSTAELYSRMALATRELNLEGANLITITESINKAIILSGASAKEANNGLIQLSQGLASGRLTGDELRSTLEQLPIVADVIAKQLGVTRGELRALGAEGKITSIKIIRAFQNAEAELEAKFAKTVPTLSQSFVVLRNNVVAFIGRINEGTGILRGFGNVIRGIGTNLAIITKSLALLGVTLAAIKFAPAIQGFFALQAAAKKGTLTILGSVTAIKAQTAFLAEQAVAEAASARATAFKTQAVITQIQAERARAVVIAGSSQAMLAQAAIEKQLSALKKRLIVEENAYAAAQLRSAAATATANAQANILTRTLVRLKVAILSLNKAIAANLIGIFVVAIAAAVAALIIFRNDIKLTKDGLGTLGDFFAEFFDQLKIALGVLGDFFSDAFEPLVVAVKDALNIIDFEFADLIRVPALFVDRTIGLFLGLFSSIVSIFKSLPKVLGSAFIITVNGIIDSIEFLPDVFIGVVKTIGQILGIFITGQIRALELLAQAAQASLQLRPGLAASLAAEAGEESARAFERATTGVGDRFAQNIKKELDNELIKRLENPFKNAFSELGSTALNAFSDSADFSGVRDFVEGLLKGANQRGADRAAADATEAKAEADRKASTEALARAEAIQKVLVPLAEENRLLGIAIDQGQREADIQQKLAQVRKKLLDDGIKLNLLQALFTEGIIRQNVARGENLALQKRLVPVEEQLAERTRIANQAFDAGAISAAQFAEELRNIDLAAANAGNSLGDGFTRTMAKMKEEAEDLASVMEDVLGASFNAVSDALADFAITGQLNFKEFAKSLIDDIIRIITKLLVLKAIQAATGTGGIPAPVPDTAAHGSGAARANKPFLVGEEGPEIFTPGQTGSITPTDQTIEALSNGAGSGGETVVIQAPAPEVNVNTIVVDDPSKIPTGIESPDGQQAVLNVINQNRSAIKRNIS